MTREEQINKAAEDFAHSISSIRPELNRDSFIRGAKWADRTMLEKTCKWMREEFYTSKDRDGHNILISASWDNVEELVEDFKKQMEA